MNAVDAALTSRRSVRGFLDTPVDQATIAHLLDMAARVPSGTNMQPWRVIALAGAALAEFCAAVTQAYSSGAEKMASERPYYPHPLHEPYLARRRKIGWDLYATLGIARGEREKAAAHIVRNLHFFGAPVGLIFVIDRRLEVGSWLDYGMFLQSVSVGARGHGLDTCAMAIFAEFPRTVRAVLEIPEDDIIVCGMAIGHEDKSAPANALRTERIAAADFAVFNGF